MVRTVAAAGASRTEETEPAEEGRTWAKRSGSACDWLASPLGVASDASSVMELFDGIGRPRSGTSCTIVEKLIVLRMADDEAGTAPGGAMCEARRSRSDTRMIGILLLTKAVLSLKEVSHESGPEEEAPPLLPLAAEEVTASDGWVEAGPSAWSPTAS